MKLNYRGGDMFTGLSTKQIASEYKTIIRRFERSQKPPREGLLLAHYTTADVLKKIIESNEIWMSHPFNMNDVEEMRFGVNLGKTIFKDYCYSSEIPKHKSDRMLQVFLNAEEYQNQEQIIDHYVLCFTEHSPDDTDGSLPMWRSYGDAGHGAAIVFDPAKFPIDSNHRMRVRKVIYGSASDREKILASTLKEWLSKTLEIHELIHDDQLYLPAYAAFFLVKKFSLITKHIGFSPEDEWRMIYSPDLDPAEILKDLVGYNIGKRGFEPKLKLNIGNYNNSIKKCNDRYMMKLKQKSLGPLQMKFVDIVDRILLGPSMDSQLAKHTFLRAIKGTDFEALIDQVHASTIPLRPSK